MNASNSIRTTLSIAVILAAASAANAQTINLNINAEGEDPRTGLSGPAGGAGEFWDQRSSTEETGLRDQFGLPTNVGYSFTVSGTMSGPWNWGDPDLGLIASGVGNFFRGVDEPQQLVINGLTAGDTYDVWIASANTFSLFTDPSSSQRAKGEWSTPNVTTTVGSQAIDNTLSVNATTWESGNNYVRFEDIVVDVNGELVFDGFSIDEVPTFDNRLPVNGFQLIDPNPPIPVILSLEVNTSSGLITLRGDSNENFVINSYQITSELGQLDTTGWNSLDDQDFPAGLAGDFDSNGAVAGADFLKWQTDGLSPAELTNWEDNYGKSGGGASTGWEEGGAVSTTYLGEAMLVGNSTIAAGASISLGTSYNGPTAGDLTFEYRTAEGLILPGIVSYVGAVAAATVPEPSSSALAALGLMSLSSRRRKLGRGALWADITMNTQGNMTFGSNVGPTFSVISDNIEAASPAGAPLR